jgi:hypothetical protein
VRYRFPKPKSKFIKIQQNPGSGQANPSKEKAWISFDRLVRIEPFQSVMPTPSGQKILFLFPCRLAARALPVHHSATGAMYHDF